MSKTKARLARVPDFGGGAGSLIRSGSGRAEEPPASVALSAVEVDEKRRAEREAKRRAERAKPSVKRGLREGFTRATFIVREENLERLKNYAYWSRVEIKDAIDEALETYLKGKTTKPRPKGTGDA